MNITGLIVAILVFAALVLIHELGHFIAAKWAGVYVQEFAIGFPPRIWGFKRGETQYSINALPLGGYVLMLGENGDLSQTAGESPNLVALAESPILGGNVGKQPTNVDMSRSFGVQPASRRGIILIAGVTMNMILAIVLYSGLFTSLGVPPEKYISKVGSIQAGTPAQLGGLLAGDKILTINGLDARNYKNALDDVTTVVKNDTSNSANIPIVMVVQRGDMQETLNLIARRNPPSGEGRIGFAFDLSSQVSHIKWWESPGYAIHTVFVGNFVAVGDGFHQILVGAISPRDAFSGPVGIVKATSDASSQGIAPVLNIMAFLSWNLAVFNLLPIPGLDGGRLLLIGIEVLRRGRKLAPQRELVINLAGLGLLFSLIILFTINDIGHILSGK